MAKNHAFLDANKRTTAVCLELFLQVNGHVLTAGDDAFFETILALAEGTLSEQALRSWISENSEPIPRASPTRTV